MADGTEFCWTKQAARAEPASFPWDDGQGGRPYVDAQIAKAINSDALAAVVRDLVNASITARLDSIDMRVGKSKPTLRRSRASRPAWYTKGYGAAVLIPHATRLVTAVRFGFANGRPN
jgi:hypothetical protein